MLEFFSLIHNRMMKTASFRSKSLIPQTKSIHPSCGGEVHLLRKMVHKGQHDEDQVRVAATRFTSPQWGVMATCCFSRDPGSLNMHVAKQHHAVVPDLLAAHP